MKNGLKYSYGIITNTVRIIIVILAAVLLHKKDYGNLGILAVTMLLTFYDTALKKVFRIELCIEIKTALILFIFAAQILGTVLDFYGRFLWWDTLLHAMSGIIFFFVGKTLAVQIDKGTANMGLSRAFIIVFAFCFSLAAGVVWEIFEFAVDGILGKNMQITQGLSGRAAIMDTMIDLISMTAGAAATAVAEFLRSGGRRGKHRKV